MREWADRAISFTNSLKSFGHGSEASAEAADPISTADLETLQASLSATIPPPFAKFLTTASSELSCVYSIVIYREPTEIAQQHFAKHLDLMQERIHGGPTFFNTNNLQDGIQQCVDGGDVLSDVYPDCAKKWMTAFPLLDIGNADMVAFDVPINPDNPPIIYLCHDYDIVPTLAPDFETFLTEWARINYIDLEIWDLKEWGFLDTKTGYLSADSGDLARLLQKFQPAQNAG